MEKASGMLITITFIGSGPAEELIKKWFDKNPKNKKVTILRPTVIFGERNRGNVYNLLKQISS